MNIRLALRDMVRRPAFAAAIILTLTISLGTTIAAFAFIDAVFLTRLPVRDQKRLVVMTAKEYPVPWKMRAQLAQHERAFSGVTAFSSFGAFPFAGRDGQRTFHVVRAAVAGNFFDVLGTRPELGRLLRPEDDVLGAPGTVLLSDQLWRRDFGAVTGPSLLHARLARPRALATLFAALSGTALLLAAVGLFGVLSAYIRERRREIAVRSALGATPAQLRGLVLAQTLTMGVVGVACGLPLAFGGSSVLRKMVSDVQAPDALTILAVAIVLVAVVGAAAYGPMIRASRVDPRTALAE